MNKYLYSAFTAALALVASTSIATTSFAAEFPDTVKVTNGQVKGSYDAAHKTVKWMGVPYAKAERWQVPQKAAKSNAVIDCVEAAPVNIQRGPKGVVGKENVLTCDVYRPDTKEANLPIMVYLHGGNNQASNSRLWEGNKFANEANVVYVSLQYRLGSLGFNALPALKDKGTGNFGFLDQAKALDWVKANAKSFGGDPKNITVSGFSAGGRDVLAMLISPAFKNKFNKIVSLSGGLTVADEAKSQKVIAHQYAPLVLADKKAATHEEAEQWLLSTNKKDMQEVRQYLNSVSADRLAPIMAGAVIRMSAFPHLYGDNKVLPAEGFQKKAVSNVPVMLMASADEFSSFAARDPFFKNRLQKVNKDEQTTKEFAYANRYGSLMYGYFNGQEAAADLGKTYTAPIYVMTFGFGHNAATTNKGFATRNGALHGVFMPFLSDQPYPFTKNVPAFNQQGAKDLSKTFIASLGAFMRTGNPNNPELGTTWKPWTAKHKNEIVFDAIGDKKIITARENNINYDEILAALDADNSISKESKDIIVHSVLAGRWFSKPNDAHFNNTDLWEVHNK